MKMKNKDISIKNLNPVFTQPLQKFDLMHKEMTGEQIVITSANDGKHMDTSKHYWGDAIDVRMWNYVELSELDQRSFLAQTEKIFPPQLFDVVLESDHFHIEFDPKPRKLSDDDLDPREPSKQKIGKPANPKLKFRLTWLKRSGFKRISSLIIGSIGTVLALLPKYGHIGELVLYFAGALNITGTIDGIRKNKKSDDKTQIIKFILQWIAGYLTKLMNKNKEK